MVAGKLDQADWIGSGAEGGKTGGWWRNLHQPTHCIAKVPADKKRMGEDKVEFDWFHLQMDYQPEGMADHLSDQDDEKGGREEKKTSSEEEDSPREAEFEVSFAYKEDSAAAAGMADHLSVLDDEYGGRGEEKTSSGQEYIPCEADFEEPFEYKEDSAAPGNEKRDTGNFQDYILRKATFGRGVVIAKAGRNKVSSLRALDASHTSLTLADSSGYTLNCSIWSENKVEAGVLQEQDFYDILIQKYGQLII